MAPKLTSFPSLPIPLVALALIHLPLATEAQQPAGSASTQAPASTLEATEVTAQSAPRPSYTVARPARSEVRQSEPMRAPVLNDASPVEATELVLTPTRVVETNFSSPFVVDTISETELAQRGVRTVPEAFSRTPGVLVQKTSQGQGSPIIRGFTGYHTLFLIDGVRLNNSTFRSGPNQYWNTVDSFGLSAMELVMSQGSVLYGSDAVGGTVQAMTKRPIYADQGFHSEGRSFSRYAGGENSFVQRMEYSASEADNYGWIIGGTFKDFGDIRAAELGNLPHTGYGEWDMDAKFEYFLDSDTRLTFFHQQVHLDDAWRTHSTIYSRSFAGTAIGTDQARILDQHRLLSYVQLEGEAQNDWFDHYALTVSHQRQDEEEFRRRANGRYQVQGVTVNTIGFSAQFDRYLDWTDVTYGINYDHDQVGSLNNEWNANGTPRPARIQGPVGDDAAYDLASAFIHTSTLLTDRTRVDLGARYTFAAADIGRVEDTANGGRLISIQDQWQNVVGSGRVSYQLDENDQYRLFGGVSQAFRAPNLSDLSRLDTARSGELEIPSPGLSPEYFLTYEAGIKASTERLNGTLAYFFTDISDLIQRSPNGIGVPPNLQVIKSNSGDGYVHGVELSFDYDMTDQVNVFGGFAYQDSRITAYPTSAPILQEEHLTRTLPTNGFLGSRWTSPDERLWLEGMVQVFDRGDRLSSSDHRDTERIPPGGTPGYTLWSLRSGWKATDKINMNTTVDNLSNTAYRTHGSGTNEPGINLIFGAEVKF